MFQIMDILNLYHKKYVGDYLQDPLVWDLCRYINLNLSSDLSLEHLSRVFSINRTSLSERFKAVMKKTISEYIKERRINHIKHLLAFTELRLSEICEQAGIHDRTYLSKMFAKSEGVTPLKYRKSRVYYRKSEFGKAVNKKEDYINAQLYAYTLKQKNPLS